MPKYSSTSRKNLGECHSDLQVIFEEVIKHFDCTVMKGHRGEAEQTAAFKSGNSKLPYPKSKHNKIPSMAADVAPYPIIWKNTNRMRYFAGFVMGIAEELLKNGKISHGLRWGGDWDMDTELSDNRWNDLVHFELVKHD